MRAKLDDQATNDGLRRNTTIKAIGKDSEFPAELAKFLHQHAAWMVRELFEGQLEGLQIALSFDSTNHKRLGHYVPGRTGHGLKWSVNLNQQHLDRPEVELLRTLLHELAHAWQHEHGKPSTSWYHNNQYQEKAESLGIPCNGRGRSTGIAKGGPFYAYCLRHGVELDPKNRGKETKGRSTLAKWTCGCGVNVRVGIPIFSATCNLCGTVFVWQD